MENQEQRKVGQILTNEGIITPNDLNEALQEQSRSGRFIGEILVARGAATEEQVAKCLSQQLGFAFVDLSEINVEPKALALVPERMATRLKALPLFISQNTLTVAMANPLDVKVIDELQEVSGLRIKAVFGCPSAIRDAIEEKHHKTKEGQVLASSGIFVSKGPSISSKTETPTEEVASLKHAASLAPVVEMVNEFIAHAVEMSASDIHLEPQRNKYECRYRIDGLLYPISEFPLVSQAAVISRIKIMANMDIAEKRLPQDGRIQMSISGRDIDLRVSTFPTIYGENLAIRILDRSQGILNLEQLGFSSANLKAFSRLIHRPYGIILVTGPTGSGKTTTLYAALSQINSVEKNVITLEDPVEYEIPHIRQSQVNVKAGLTFATGLRSILRQDPDIIMIGEIRDKETADIAIHAALTGHLVFTTLHTNDATSAATRLIDMGVEPFLVASSLVGILAQRLLRILCPHCKQSYKPSPQLLLEVKLDKTKADKKYTFYKETGCSKCNERGYIGRSGIYELLIPNDKIKEMITRKASDAILREEARKAGMKTLTQAGLENVIAGNASVSELLRVTENA
ncbi:MAG: Flp pilus assembly complex ATPase component TadA [Candidatus Omnitrophica bacterium]|nr:Flp pilus assembly complex ATPase component TadA [Candidatus Omnitrophota bacterium]